MLSRLISILMVSNNFQIEVTQLLFLKVKKTTLMLQKLKTSFYLGS